MRLIRYLMPVVSGLFISASVWASTYTINTTVNVGSLDTLRASATLANSGDATELGWIQSVLGSTYTMTKFDVTESSWTRTDQSSDVFATDLGLDAGDYFFIKIGNNGSLDSHFLFKNMDSLSWAVISLKDSFGGEVELKNIGKVSHIGNVSAVPLPAAAWLFGSALLGFVTLSNRKKL